MAIKIREKERTNFKDLNKDKSYPKEVSQTINQTTFWVKFCCVGIKINVLIIMQTELMLAKVKNLCKI